MIIVQIGSNDGKDHVFNFISQYDGIIQKIFLIDANPNCVEKTKDQYKHFPQTLCLNYAVTPDWQSEDIFTTLFLPKNDEFNAHASLLKEHIEKHDHFEFVKLDIPAISFNQLCEKFELQHIDRLYIDVEGLDIDILNSINLAKINIPYICFEFIHSDGVLSFGGPKLEKYKNYLSTMGYILTTEEYNIIAIKR
jgi:FkbM family methyltransferase